MLLEYDTFDLAIEPWGEHYRAQVIESPAGQASTEFSLPFSDLQVENFFLRLGRFKGPARRVLSSEMTAARKFGGALFEAVFAGEVLSRFRLSADRADRGGAGLRIRLRLRAPEVADLPWEYLYDSAGDRFLALSSETPIVRYLELAERIRPLEVEPPLEVLTLIASPAGYPPLDVEREYRNLRRALDDLVRRGLVSLDRLTQPTLAGLQRRLRQRAYNIVHFIGHGGFDPHSQDGVLLFEDENRRSQQVGSLFLGTLLHDHRSLRLAVLNACEGARGLRSDPFSGMAQSLVKQGIPAVIAMQFEISDEAAILFSEAFYAAMVDGYPVDAALAESRKAIFTSLNELEWGTPVLFLRTLDGRIFDVPAPAPPPPSPELAPSPSPTPMNAAVILVPVDQGQVLQRTTVYGRTDSLDPDLQPWLVVEIPNGALYPQVPVTRRLGDWSNDVRIGRAEKGLDVGAEFTILLVVVGAETNFQFSRYIRGQHESKDGLGSLWAEDMIVLDKRRVVRGPY